MKNEILIDELTPSQAGLITESASDGSGNLYLNGIFMQANIKNRNGRLYPMNEIAQAVQTANASIIESKGLIGELDHPQSHQINLDRVSHVITEMAMNGTNAIGKAKILPTPMGNIARALLESGVAIGVSSRGTGAVNEGSVSGFRFITVDIVAQPSAPSAYPQSIQESLEMAQNGHEIINLAESVRSDAAAQKYFKKEIMKFLNTGLFAKK